MSDKQNNGGKSGSGNSGRQEFRDGYSPKPTSESKSVSPPPKNP